MGSFHNGRIVIVQDDITSLRVDAIVNAANTGLLGGGGVDGAIHRAAGPALLEACRELNGCETGSVKVTPGFNLDAKYVFHAVGPVWNGGERNEDQLLQGCYRSSLDRALEHRVRSIAFPAISTGVYRFPLERATRLAIGTVCEHPFVQTDSCNVVFCCFDKRTLDVYMTIAGETLEASSQTGTD